MCLSSYTDPMTLDDSQVSLEEMFPVKTVDSMFLSSVLVQGSTS